MTEIVREEYLEMCRGKSFLLSKAVASGTECLTCKAVANETSKDELSPGFKCLRAISDAKMKIELKYGAKMGAGHTKRYLRAEGFKEKTPLGADQIITNETLCLHHSELDKNGWVEAFQTYAAQTKYGVLILAKTPENLQHWVKSGPCLREVNGIPEGRLFVYIEHTKNDEGGEQGYICDLSSGDSNTASATVPNGRGYLLHADGEYYHGHLNKGLRHGEGKNSRANGSVYDGDWKDNKKNGKGKYTWASGAVYDGNWKDDKKNGKGKNTWASGVVYDGDWKDDKMHGKGKYTWANGDIYDGDWKDEKKNGKGKFTWANGAVYDGDWEDDKRHK